jgi:hypothetical protein
VSEAGNQTLVREVPASFVYSDFDMIAEGTGKNNLTKYSSE